MVGRLDALPGYLWVSGRVNMAFRQRLWLVVTSVNDCRYCRYLHSTIALRHGVSFAEVKTLSSGVITDSPAEERPWLLYGLNWAKQDGRTDPEARARLVTSYGTAHGPLARTGAADHSLLQPVREHLGSHAAQALGRSPGRESSV